MEDMWLWCGLGCLTVGQSWGPDQALIRTRATGQVRVWKTYLPLGKHSALEEA